MGRLIRKLDLMNQNTAPKVSIITVVLNGKETLEETIRSVVSQSYRNIEYIVVDGDSKDGTLEIIRRYEKDICRWISEPDRGLYDAMNKALDLATGEWVCFMNAGDWFIDRDTVKAVFAEPKIFGEVIYGNTLLRLGGGVSRTEAALDPCQLRWKMPFCHQSSFVRTGVIQSMRFDTRFRYGADYDLFLRLYEANYRFTRYDGIMSSVAAGGLADTRRKSVLLEHWNITRLHTQKTLRTDLYFLWRLLDHGLKSLVKLFLPEEVVRLFRSWKMAS